MWGFYFRSFLREGSSRQAPLCGRFGDTADVSIGLAAGAAPLMTPANEAVSFSIPADLYSPCFSVQSQNAAYLSTQVTAR